ncbi:hypothetical protein MKW92_014394 [Papaver armeniacum]|nr:hypothetical protein MKW92_014394 [Papaver armeniacum]
MNIRVLDVEAENSRLKAEAEKSALERKDMLSGLEKQVADLTLKLAQCCGGGSPTEEPWITDQAVPSNWVAFEELCVLEYSQNIPLIVTKATGGLKLGDDKTTNVQANCFYRGKFPIMVVDVAELTPNREEARFDPCIWGSYTHAGNTYAARKLFASEMSGDAHKTC